jgi:hypothetical protein
MEANWACGGCNEIDEAFEWLEKAYQERSPLLTHLTYAPFDSVRSDPRFEDILRRMNLTEFDVR